MYSVLVYLLKKSVHQVKGKLSPFISLKTFHICFSLTLLGRFSMRTALVHDVECWAATTFLSCSVNTALYSFWTSAKGVLTPSQERVEETRSKL